MAVFPKDRVNRESHQPDYHIQGGVGLNSDDIDSSHLVCGGLGPFDLILSNTCQLEPRFGLDFAHTKEPVES